MLDKNKLTKGMVVKNYKELCLLMRIEPTRGNTKKKHLKELESICKYTKDGNSFVIEEIYETPLPIVDNRKEYLKFESFKVDENKFNNKGVYMIRLNNEVYIGSTTYGFRKRFMQHKNNWKQNMPYTEDLIKRGGVFSILHDMTDIEDIELIRMVEEEYILFYTHETDYDVINRRINTPKKPKIKYKTIKIEEEYYEQIIKYYNELRGECDE